VLRDDLDARDRESLLMESPPPSLLELRDLLEQAWCAETAYDSFTYEGRDPAWGQCYVTAVFLYHHLDGEIKRGWVSSPEMRPCRHYWNQIDGLDIDLTWRQFPAGSRLTDIERVDKKCLLASVDARARYDLLVKNVANLRAEPS